MWCSCKSRGEGRGARGEGARRFPFLVPRIGASKQSRGEGLGTRGEGAPSQQKVLTQPAPSFPVLMGDHTHRIGRRIALLFPSPLAPRPSALHQQ